MDFLPQKPHTWLEAQVMKMTGKRKVNGRWLPQVESLSKLFRLRSAPLYLLPRSEERWEEMQKKRKEQGIAYLVTVLIILRLTGMHISHVLSRWNAHKHMDTNHFWDCRMKISLVPAASQISQWEKNSFPSLSTCKTNKIHRRARTWGYKRIQQVYDLVETWFEYS